MSMLPKIVGLISALSGAVGTWLLYKGSFAYEQMAYYSNHAMAEEVGKRNKTRHSLQRAGLILIMISFVLAGISVLLG
jgi:hypothetical protein